MYGILKMRICFRLKHRLTKLNTKCLLSVMLNLNQKIQITFKVRLKILCLFLSILAGFSKVYAEPLQDAFRYGTYGLVAGAIVGGASMAFSEDPGSRLSPVAKGASLGLYAGLIVAIYKNVEPNEKDHQFDVFPVGFQTSDKKETLGLVIQSRF